MTDATYISFYSKSGCIRVFKASVRAIGLPKFIRFRINKDATLLIVEPFDWINGRSYRVPGKVLPKQSMILFDLSEAKEIYNEAYV